jgi:single-strand DNA-binding protein|tara:strand:+ start:364 stop:780 length:417 start_codon:yes stop_codon:yes gene_type:complete
MAYDNTVSVVGNLTRDPELRFTNTGLAVASFGIAWNQKSQNGEDKAHFFDIDVWRELAENVAESFSKGDRVYVFGRLNWSTWNATDGTQKSKVSITAEDVGLSAKWVNVSAGPKKERNAAPNNHASLPGRDQKNEEPF